MNGILESMIKTKLSEYAMSYVENLMEETGLSEEESINQVITVLKQQLEARML